MIGPALVCCATLSQAVGGCPLTGVAPEPVTAVDVSAVGTGIAGVGYQPGAPVLFPPLSIRVRRYVTDAWCVRVPTANAADYVVEVALSGADGANRLSDPEATDGSLLVSALATGMRVERRGPERVLVGDVVLEFDLGATTSPGSYSGQLVVRVAPR
jgi:hypothetical protein